ncbi:OprD family outer membrane porin [Acinetobacter puyangensis]|uniref:OprD family outer membrane porin n=1 Tax=Acinetobacter puyangensis TaxID=1096779 RepID=UPI003A4D3E7E
MFKKHNLALVLSVYTALISTTFASEQSESKGFVEDASGTVLFRNGFIQRDKKHVNPGDDNNSWLQSTMINLESGFTQGTIGFGVDVIGDFSFKLGDNNHSGNSMIPRKDDGSPYDQWTRGGGVVKARISNTTIKYGTQVLDLPVLASMTTRNVPEYFTGALVTSNEINNLALVAGKFTKNQQPDQIASDQNQLDRAVVWGAKYKINDQLNASYYGTDLKDKLERHYANVNYQYVLADDSTLTYDLSGYHTKFEANAKTYSATGTTAADYSNTGIAGQKKTNNIWALSGTYKTGPHSIMLAYQQNSGNVGYDYGQNADGGQSVYLPNSYLSDFIGNDEKSVQAQYSLDFGAFNLPALNWTTAYVYGWDINLKDSDDTAKESEFFNQLSYTVQNGFAKDLKLRVRNSIYRNDQAYADQYMPDTNEWRIFVDFPVKLF